MVADGSTPPTAEVPLPNIPPINRPGERQAAATLSRPPVAERKRLLVVDDEETVLRLLVRVLSIDNYDIQSAESGVSAARLLEMPGFAGVDLLVTDLLMPNMNGRELAAVVRQRYPSVRVLYVTGFADSLFRSEHELGEGESFIEKPFGAKGLLEATRLLMFGHLAEEEEQQDKRDDSVELTDDRLRSRFVRLLKRLRFAPRVWR